MKILNNNKGQILLIATILVFFISVYSLILVDSLIYSIKINKILNDKVTALWLAEAGVQKAVWCLNQTSGENCGGTFGDDYVGETGVSLDGGTLTTTLTGTGTNRDITSIGMYYNVIKTMHTSLIKSPETTTVLFEYAVLAGSNETNLSSNVTISGDLYSNSDVTCASSTVIDGNVTVSGVSEIKGCQINGGAKANIIRDSTISGDVYYQTIINSTVGGTSYSGSPDPEPIDFPITDQMINDWANDAEEGGIYSGDYTITEDTSLGPLKITGNFEIKSNKILTLTGVIYVKGEIILDSNVEVVLDSAYGPNSGLIISEGNIDSHSNVEFIGTPEGGQIVFITTSTDHDEAIELNSNAGSAVFYAANGGLDLDSGNQVFQITGRKEIDVDSNSSINYDPNLAYISYLSDITAPAFWNLVKGSRSE